MYAHGPLAVAVTARSEADACCSDSAQLAKQQEAVLRTQFNFAVSASEARSLTPWLCARQRWEAGRAFRQHPPLIYP